MKHNNSLRFQLSLRLAGVVVASVLFVVLGTYAFVAWGEYQFWNSLSPAAQEAYELNWEESGMPEAHLVQEISLAEEGILAPVYEEVLRIVAVLSMIAIAVGSFLGPILARRLTAPLELATDSARTIASGEFSHRMEVPDHSPKEVVSLAESFTHLAESLERMEQNIQYTSASIAHEIRTPLTVLQGYLQGMRDGVFEAEDEQFDLMLRRIEALGRLIDDLKTLSLAQAGRLRLEIAPTDLRGRLRELVDWVQREQRNQPITFEETGAPAGKEQMVQVDAERIEQVVLALVHNALDYSAEKGCVVVRFAAGAREVVLTVDDEGPGFSEEALAHAGERFWRDESSRSRETGGSGLGLAVAKALVEAHGGRLLLANRETGGGSVQIRLPTDAGLRS